MVSPMRLDYKLHESKGLAWLGHLCTPVPAPGLAKRTCSVHICSWNECWDSMEGGAFSWWWYLCDNMTHFSPKEREEAPQWGCGPIITPVELMERNLRSVWEPGIRKHSDTPHAVRGCLVKRSPLQGWGLWRWAAGLGAHHKVVVGTDWMARVIMSLHFVSVPLRP